jgi:RNA polymerase sigma-70 factor, ECF subfamily
MKRTPPSRPEFVELYEHAGRRLLGYLMRRMQDADAAAELWAECWAIAFEQWPRCRRSGEGGAEGWLYGIARNQLALYYRSGSIERRALERLRWSVPPVDPQMHDELERVSDQNEMRTAVDNAMRTLSAKGRLALRLRVVEGRDYGDVAQRLGCTEQAARAQVSRSLRRLAEVLDRYELTTQGAVSQ